MTDTRMPPLVQRRQAHDEFNSALSLLSDQKLHQRLAEADRSPGWRANKS